MNERIAFLLIKNFIIIFKCQKFAGFYQQIAMQWWDLGLVAFASVTCGTQIVLCDTLL
jgi:hypothetical protein